MNLLKSNVKIIDFKGGIFYDIPKENVENVFYHDIYGNKATFKNDIFKLGKLCYNLLFLINDNTDNFDSIKNN